MSLLYWLVAVLVFGLLIFIHELGHFITARIFGVTVYEFSIGMGPAMITYTSKKTNIKYALRVFPLGGYVSMAGEDEESDDPNAFDKKPSWQRFIVTAAGGVVNLLFGALLTLAVVLASAPLGSTAIHSYPEQSNHEISSEESGLRPGDVILAVNGSRVHVVNDLAYEIMHDAGQGPVDVRILRDGEEMTLSVTFPTAVSSGTRVGLLDFYVQAEEMTFGNVLKHTFYRSLSTVKMVWESLIDLVSGRYGMEAVSGPVGVAGAISDAAATDIVQLLYLVAIISINLGVVNLLPLPALDGGRLFFLLFEMIARRPVLAKKHEALIHGIGIMLLLGFMIIVTFKDIFSFFG